jgi:hypothetical protein
MRKFLYHSLSVLLFIFLVATAWSSAATLTFSKPDKVKGWLHESKIYDHFVDTAIEESQKSTNQDSPANDTGGLSLGDPGVQNAAKAAFTPVTVENAVNTFLDANYSWLQGKTEKPEFKIDLAQAKAALATNLGAYAEQRATTLPKCTNFVEAAQNFDALTATCLPPGVTAAMAGKLVQEKVANSQDFLANPVVTQDTLGDQKVSDAGQPTTREEQPYYENLSSLPSAYRLATAMPWILAVLTVLIGLGVVLLAPARRRGLRRTAILLASAGAVVLLLILISATAFNKLESRVFTKDNVGQLQESLVDFAHRAQSALVKVDLWFGIVFVLLGVATLVALKYLWPGNDTPNPPETTADEPTPPKDTTPIQV